MAVSLCVAVFVLETLLSQINPWKILLWEVQFCIRLEKIDRFFLSLLFYFIFLLLLFLHICLLNILFIDAAQTLLSFQSLFVQFHISLPSHITSLNSGDSNLISHSGDIARVWGLLPMLRCIEGTQEKVSWFVYWEIKFTVLEWIVISIKIYYQLSMSIQ